MVNNTSQLRKLLMDDVMQGKKTENGFRKRVYVFGDFMYAIVKQTRPIFGDYYLPKYHYDAWIAPEKIRDEIQPMIITVWKWRSENKSPSEFTQSFPVGDEEISMTLLMKRLVDVNQGPGTSKHRNVNAMLQAMTRDRNTNKSYTIHGSSHEYKLVQPNRNRLKIQMYPLANRTQPPLESSNMKPNNYVYTPPSNKAFQMALKNAMNQVQIQHTAQEILKISNARSHDYMYANLVRSGQLQSTLMEMEKRLIRVRQRRINVNRRNKVERDRKLQIPRR